MEAFSLFEVNQYIRRVIALNFEEPIWVECEINQVSQSRGHAYLELIEKEEDSEDIIARNSGTIWYKQLAFIRKKLGKIADDILTEGVKVKLKVQVEYKERFGLSLNILDIDPAFTFGQYELQRQKIIERLEKEDLIERNSLLELPTVIQKIAVISSESAAGYQDFLNHLNNNSYGFAYRTMLFKAAMQGQKTEREVVSAIKKAIEYNFDVIVIIRGGGSKLDLSAFDNYKIAAAIANAPVPVFTGIGHDIDMTVADIVSHTVLKTPTAVADFCIEQNLEFESDLTYIFQSIAQHATNTLHLIRQRLDFISNQLTSIPATTVFLKRQRLNSMLEAAFHAASQLQSRQMQSLENVNRIIELMQPQNVLKKGFTLVKHHDNYIPKKSKLTKKMSELDIEFFDGTVKVKIDEDEK